MKILACVLCLIQITTSFVLNVTQLNSIVSIQQAIPAQDDIGTVGKVFHAPSVCPRDKLIFSNM